MPNILENLRRSLRRPRGYVADGRVLGLGLATALAKQQESMRINADDAERHLRRWAADESLGIRR
ncbi:hypothetical protein HNP84_007724 [Thermocatellispora tengchongensis]|uniref:Uncharacterized protein n=1 Tax=Thermocatellispora tengchongensis TaxID=1073253 RepID=A0A840PJI3_9ACTN|nr:hypothetical protein [Thermocatellispora tengchongensis]MBB5137971.1 hypothetical protein [Thermocatellispora tengchongensis]